MNDSPYLISGTARRALKKEMHQLKRMIKYQPHFIDLMEVCGGGADMEIEEKWKIEAEARIIEIEKSLAQLTTILFKSI